VLQGGCSACWRCCANVTCSILRSSNRIVVDYKLFTPGQPLPAGTVWISETMPGYAERGDVSEYINGPSGAWFSFNIPFYSLMLREGGYHPNAHHDCPRARMFRRAVEQRSIVDLESFVAFMHYNNRTDPLAEGDACNGISARCDLNAGKHDCFGAIDLKVSSSSLQAKGLDWHGMMAPSWNHADNPPFAWSSSGNCKQSDPHAGQPNVFNFTMLTYPAAT
jgi:hypothetical protein